jgi:Domain of unknown function (DUF397)
MIAYEMHIEDDRSNSEPPNWRKCSLSYSSGGCVEVAGGWRGLVRVRDSKNPGGTVLGFSPADWTMFVGKIRSGGA